MIILTKVISQERICNKKEGRKKKKQKWKKKENADKEKEKKRIYRQ